MDGWIDGWMDGMMDGWMDGSTDRQTDIDRNSVPDISLGGVGVGGADCHCCHQYPAKRQVQSV